MIGLGLRPAPSRVRPVFPPFARLFSTAILLVACAGGQSGNEGQRPVPPCAGPGGLFEGRVIEVGNGCVTVQIDHVVSTGSGVLDGDGQVLFSGQAEVGDVVVGKLGTVYAYTHDFSDGESVVIAPGAFGDVLELQLMPGGSGEVEVHWGRRFGRLPVEDLVGADCVEQLESLPDGGGSTSRSSTQSQAAPEGAHCAPSGD